MAPMSGLGEVSEKFSRSWSGWCGDGVGDCEGRVAYGWCRLGWGLGGVVRKAMWVVTQAHKRNDAQASKWPPSCIRMFK
jgi:hypothetical protein